MSVGATQAAAGRSSWPHLWLPLVCSASAWGVLFLTIPPARQDFPLDDDWAFARGAVGFASGEGIHYSGWAAMPQLGQWLWAWPFIKVLGGSFVSLRLSTIVLSWVGLVAFGDFLRGAELSPWEATAGALALAFQPLFFILQGTYMTDVPALSFSLVALALYRRGLAGGSMAWPGAAAVATLAALTRQNTLAAPVAAGFLWLRKGDGRLFRVPKRCPSPFLLLALLMPLAIGVAAHAWLQTRPDVITTHILPPPPGTLLFFPFVVIHFLGLAALPMLILASAPGGRKALAVAVLAMAAGGLALWRSPSGLLPYGPLFPYSQNLLTPWGAFGGQLVKGFGLEPLVPGQRPLLLDPYPDLNPWGRLLLTVLGCLAGAALLVRACRRPGCRQLGSLLVLFAALQVPLILVTQPIIDRYFLGLIPAAVMMALVGGMGRRRWLPTAAILLVSATVSVSLMHDWLAWSSARWTLGRRAVARGIDAHDIEGGLEWNGWYAPSPGGSVSLPLARRRLVLGSTSIWFRHVTGRYALSFAPTPGARVVDRESYTLWLAPGRRDFLLLQWLGN